LTEEKAIGFSGEGSQIHRLGALYYWAYGQAHRPGASVPLHPHRGFEIFTYVLSGQLEHRDSLGNLSLLEAEGLQLMQTGSGMEHEERFVSVPSALFQVWLDPEFRREILCDPVFLCFPAEDFYWGLLDGTQGKGRSPNHVSHSRFLLGPHSPVPLKTPGVEMQDLCLKAGDAWRGPCDEHTIWSAWVLAGKGSFAHGETSEVVKAGEVLIFQPEQACLWILSASEDLRVLWIQVLREPPYSLFPKPKGRSRERP
jgi:redox-sensitive bicupin YhaK (pirin superfamily)